MEYKSLTIGEALRFANHDFLNQLQLIHMNLELGYVDKAKEVIKNYSECCHTTSSLNKWNMPKTSEWLQTVKWRYPDFLVTLHVAQNVSHCDADVQFVRCLENTVIHLVGHLDPFVEQQLLIELKDEENQPVIDVRFEGKWAVDVSSFCWQDDLVDMIIEEANEQKWCFKLKSRK